VTPELRGRLSFFDEANVSWCPDTGRVYRVKGEEYKVDSPGKNKTWYILGSLEYPTGDGLYEYFLGCIFRFLEIPYHPVDKVDNRFLIPHDKRFKRSDMAGRKSLE
jgi:hypothetical protein